MKKMIILILAVIYAIPNISYAVSNDSRNDFMVGAKIGTNYSNVYDSEGEEFDADAKFGIALGAFVAIPFGSFFGFQPEVLFSQKGFQGKGKVLGLDYSFTRTTSYIDIPLLFTLKPNPFMTLVVGPQYSYLVKQNDAFTSDLASNDVEQEFKNDDLNNNILGFTAGVDININSVVLGARVGMDFMDNHGDGTSSTPRYKNVWGQFTVGIAIAPFK